MINENTPSLHLEALSFENFREVLNIQVDERQKGFVESPAETIAMAYAGVMEELPGELCVICLEDAPIGLALFGQAPVGEQEPEILRKYGQVFRIMGFQIDRRHQGKSLGKQALELLIQRIRQFPEGDRLPVALEVETGNTAAIHLYKSAGFSDSGVRYGKSMAFYMLPTRRQNP